MKKFLLIVFIFALCVFAYFVFIPKITFSKINFYQNETQLPGFVDPVTFYVEEYLPSNSDDVYYVASIDAEKLAYGYFISKDPTLSYKEIQFKDQVVYVVSNGKFNGETAELLTWEENQKTYAIYTDYELADYKTMKYLFDFIKKT